MRASQRGDSGTQARISNVRKAGSRPVANSPRQPIYGARKAPMTEPIMMPTGTVEVIMPPMNPRLVLGTNSCTSGKSTE